MVPWEIAQPFGEALENNIGYFGVRFRGKESGGELILLFVQCSNSIWMHTLPNVMSVFFVPKMVHSFRYSIITPMQPKLDLSLGIHQQQSPELFRIALVRLAYAICFWSIFQVHLVARGNRVCGQVVERRMASLMLWMILLFFIDRIHVLPKIGCALRWYWVLTSFQHRNLAQMSASRLSVTSRLRMSHGQLSWWPTTWSYSKVLRWRRPPAIAWYVLEMRWELGIPLAILEEAGSQGG